MALINKLEAIGDAIRNKTGKTEQLSLDQMVNEIEGIQAGPAVVPGMDTSKLSLASEAPQADNGISQYFSMLPTGWESTEIGTAALTYRDNGTTIVSSWGDYAITGFNLMPNITDINQLKALIMMRNSDLYYWFPGMSYSYREGYYIFPCLVLSYNSNYNTISITGAVNNNSWNMGIDFANKKVLTMLSGRNIGYVMIYEKGEVE